MLPPARLPCILPQLSYLTRSDPTLREEVVAGLPLTTFTPPAPVVVGLADLVFERAQSPRVLKGAGSSSRLALLVRRSCFTGAPSQGGELHLCSGPTRLGIHRAAVRERASVATLVM